jgi:hypothetical protein
MRFGPEAALLHVRLAERAAAIGHYLTDDPALALVAGGQEIPALQADADEIVYVLPPGTDRVRLRSRSRIPMELEPASGDPRRLGVALAAVLHEGVPIAADSPAFGRGFLPPEPDGWRWTDGDALLTLPPASYETTLELRLAGRWSRYWSFGAITGAPRPTG